MPWPCGASARSRTHTAALALLVQLVVASLHLTADEGRQCGANGLESSDLSDDCSQNMHGDNHSALSIQISHHGLSYRYDWQGTLRDMQLRLSLHG
mmetsp:Transcript_80743/g.130863  ORF Transcript_80743/g.130863 Transcript_80743/m.130863 type:complete len:96 (+) Transcript_80743:73-360(+)